MPWHHKNLWPCFPILGADQQLVAIVRLGSEAARQHHIGRMSACAGRAVIQRVKSRHKKPGTRPGFRFPGSGGALRALATFATEPLAFLEIPLIDT